MPKATDQTYLRKLIQVHEKHSNFAKPRPREKDSHLGFYIKHFAGDVCYKVTDFLEKNRDTLQEDLKELVASSEDEDFVQDLLNLGLTSNMSTDGLPDADADEGKSAKRSKASCKSQAQEC